MTICDLCKREANLVFKGTQRIILYSGDAMEVTEFEICYDCKDFIKELIEDETLFKMLREKESKLPKQLVTRKPFWGPVDVGDIESGTKVRN